MAPIRNPVQLINIPKRIPYLIPIMQANMEKGIIGIVAITAEKRNIIYKFEVSLLLIQLTNKSRFKSPTQKMSI